MSCPCPPIRSSCRRPLPFKWLAISNRPSADPTRVHGFADNDRQRGGQCNGMPGGKGRKARHINGRYLGYHLRMGMPVAHQAPASGVGLRDLLPAALSIQFQPRPPGSIGRMWRCGAGKHEPSPIVRVNKELSAALGRPNPLAMCTQQLRHGLGDKQFCTMTGPPPSPGNLVQARSSEGGQSRSNTT